MQSVAEELQSIDDFNKLLPFLKDRMGWPIEPDVFDEDDPLEEATFEFAPQELGIDPSKVPNIREIRQLRSFHPDQPFGIFLISFEDKDLRVTAMRRILRALVKKKREAGNPGTQQRWDPNDLMFVSNFGQSGHRKISFAHFHQDNESNELPTLRVIGWDEDDTPTRIRIQAGELTQKLKFPDDPANVDAWRAQWNEAFTQKPGQVISTTKDLVAQLAKLAIQTRRAIEDVLSLENQNGALHSIMYAFKKTIFPDLKPNGFADMYAQTVAYGLLQARISRISGGLVLDDAAKFIGATSPFLKELFESFLSVGANKSKLDFDEIGLSEVRDLLAEADMEQVLADFENKNPKQDPKIHLYESFLKEYDNVGKDNHGVFYTPREVVRFIVRSVHETLQTDFALTDGLADITTWAEFAQAHDDVIIPEGWTNKPFVQILDPATGTGTFLIETIEIIHKHLTSKWQSEGQTAQEAAASWQNYVPMHLLPRLHGFELMMAPYAMAHLGIALKLDQTGYKHTADAPRAEVYLTNSLAEPFDAEAQFGFMADALAAEGKGANRIKIDVPITVVIGNPPYSGHSMNASKDNNGKPTWIGKLIQPYFSVDGAPLGERNPKWLNDDYVKFMRYAEYQLEATGFGILGYITNHGFIDNPTFRGMRQHIIDGASKLHILDLHGNTKKKEKAPDGSKDENVFDIEQGVAITLLSKIKSASTEIYKSDLFGQRRSEKGKLSVLYSNVISQLDSVQLNPSSPAYFLFERDASLEEEFNSYLSLSNIFTLNSVGIVTAKDALLIHYLESELENSLSENQVQYSKEYTKVISYRPLDKRLIYYETSIIERPRYDIMKHMLDGDNLALVSVRQVAEGIFNHSLVVDSIVESRLTLSNKGIGYVFPFKLNAEGHYDEIETNLSRVFLRQLSEQTSCNFLPLIKKPLEQQSLGLAPPKPTQETLLSPEMVERGDLINNFGCRDVFDYIYAILHSPTYRTRYAEFLKSDFPRIPLPKGKDIFRGLVALGKELVDLHLLDEEHPKLSQPSIVFRGQGDNRLFKKNQIKLDNGKMPINATQWFEDVPQESVEFSIGGYQPLKKWLHDRAEKGGANPAPGRVLSNEDILHYRRMVVAITETRRLMGEIDDVIDAHGEWPDAFVTDSH